MRTLVDLHHIFYLQDLKLGAYENVDVKLVTKARRNYEKYYQEEKELNKKFTLFVANYQLAYQGPNTLKEQINAGVKNASKRCELF